MIPGSLSIIASTIAPNRMGKAIGMWSSVTTLFFIIGPVLGGFLSDLGLWRGVFYINIPIGIFSLIVLQTKVLETRDLTSAKQSIFWEQPSSPSAWQAGYGFTSAPDLGFSNPGVIISLIIGAIGLVIFWLV